MKKPGDPIVRFRNIIALWVLVATFGVGAVVWLFVKNATLAAVDKLSWRMTGVVRVLAQEQVSCLNVSPCHHGLWNFDFRTRAYTCDEEAASLDRTTLGFDLNNMKCWYGSVHRALSCCLFLVSGGAPRSLPALGLHPLILAVLW